MSRAEALGPRGWLHSADRSRVGGGLAERREGVPMAVQSYQPQINLTALETSAKQKGLLRKLLALALFVVFVLVLVKYHDWFRNILPGASNQAHVSTPDTTAPKTGHVRPARSRRTSSEHHADAVVPPASEAPLALAPGMTEFKIRSPLVVEVISGGGRHQVMRTRDDSIYLYSHDETLSAPDVVEANVVYGTGEIKLAAEQIRLSPGAVELASPPIGSVDLLRAKQPTAEGSVVLLARIDKDGNIQDLQAIGGPETLFASAREAVKQWRFKPYYESGQAVETEAQITVKFASSAH
jgi:TonB family protein